MNLYLVAYGAENELATFQADDVDHVIEQFCAWEPVSPDYQVNKTSINDIYLCTKVDAGEKLS